MISKTEGSLYRQPGLWEQLCKSYSSAGREKCPCPSEAGGGYGEDRVPVKGGPLPGIKSISELLHQVVLPRQSEDALFIQTMLEDELCTLLHQDGHQVGAEFLLIGYGLIQTLAKHSWEEKDRTCSSL